MKFLKALNECNRQPLYDEKMPIMLLWSQKAGCTNLTKWFFYQVDLYDQALEYHPSVHVYKAGKFFNQENYLQNIAKNHHKIDVVKLVRNPYKRAVSSFLTFSHYCYSSRRKNIGMHRDWEKVYALFYNKKPPYKGLSFKQFLYYLDEVGASATQVDGHLAQQYIEGEEHLDIQLIKVENLSEDIKRLEKSYRLKQSPPSLISQQKNHHGTKMSLDEDHSNIPITSEMLLSGKLPSYEYFYDEENFELCTKIFKKDIDQYRYHAIDQ